MGCNAYHIRITGKVQGVWFRKHTLEKAKSLGLKGFVKNEPNGTVYTEVEGSDNTLLIEFIHWLRQGPPLSRVDHVSIEEAPKCKGFIDFKIL